MTKFESIILFIYILSVVLGGGQYLIIESIDLSDGTAVEWLLVQMLTGTRPFFVLAYYGLPLFFAYVMSAIYIICLAVALKRQIHSKAN